MLPLSVYKWITRCCKLFVSTACLLQENPEFAGVPHYRAVFLLAVYLFLRHFRNSGENVCTASNVCRATIFCYAVWLFDGSHAFRPVHNSERYISSLVAQKFSLFSECTNEYMVLCAACQVPADLTHKVALALLWCPHVCQTPFFFFFFLFWSKTAVHFWPSPFLAFISSTVARKQVFLPCHIRIDFFFFFWCAREKWLTPVYGVYATSTGDVYVCVFAPSC